MSLSEEVGEIQLLAYLAESLSEPYHQHRLREPQHNSDTNNSMLKTNDCSYSDSGDVKDNKMTETEVVERIVSLWVDKYSFPKKMRTNFRKMNCYAEENGDSTDIEIETDAIVSGIINNRLTDTHWLALLRGGKRAYSDVLPIIQCIRLLVRDQYFLKMFITNDCIRSFAEIMNCCADRMAHNGIADSSSLNHYKEGDVEILVQCVAIIKRISSFCLSIDHNQNRSNASDKTKLNPVAMLIQQKVHLTLSQLVTIHNIKYEYTTVLPSVLLSLLFLAKNKSTINTDAEAALNNSLQIQEMNESCLECVRNCCLECNVLDSLIRILELSHKADSRTDLFYLKNVVVQLLLVLISEPTNSFGPDSHSNCSSNESSGSMAIRFEILECGIVAKAIKVIIQLPEKAATICSKVPDCPLMTANYVQPLLMSLLSLLSHLMSEETGLMEMRVAGAVPVLLSLLVFEKRGHEEMNGNGNGEMRDIFSSALICCIMSLFAKLATDDSCANYIRQNNGVFLLAGMLMASYDSSTTERDVNEASAIKNIFLHEQKSASERMQEKKIFSSRNGISNHTFSLAPVPPTVVYCYILRALRFLFSVERNRKVFKKLFPLELFLLFIDIGHYNDDIDDYSYLAESIGNARKEYLKSRNEQEGDGDNVYHRIINSIPELDLNNRRGNNGMQGDDVHYFEAQENDVRINQEDRILCVNGYSMTELIGRGAYGSVYQGKKDTGETQFAIKEIDMESLQQDNQRQAASPSRSESETCTTALFREVSILRSINHPNIVKYYESFIFGSNLYIVMELVEGITLLEYINSATPAPSLRKAQSRSMMQTDSHAVEDNGSLGSHASNNSNTLSFDAVWSVFVQLASALHFLHMKMKVVHRDITPSNIMVMNSLNSTNSMAAKRIKLTDFGLSTSSSKAGGSSGKKTFLRSVVGTIEYSCPEMITSNCYDEKADVWSAGCVLYHMLAKKPPFKGANPFSTAALIVDGDYAPLSEYIRAQYGSKLVSLTSQLLQKDPEKRPSISEVGSLISDQIISEMDRMQQEEDRLFEQLLIERDRRLKENSIANKQQEAFRRLLVTREGDGSNGRCAVASESHSDAHCDANSSAPMGNGSKIETHLEAPSSSFSISISQSKVRQIADPTTQVLGLMHKLMFVSTLPMHGCPVGTIKNAQSSKHDISSAGLLDANMKRKSVDRYVARHLFSADFRGSSIKHEVVKLLEGSHEIIPIDFSMKILNYDNDSRRQLVPNRITYERMKAMIEEIITEHGYYTSTRS